MTDVTTPATDLFVLTPALDLPPATIAALMEVEPEGRRMWVWSILITALDGRRTVAAVREVLNHERMDRALVARLTDPMQEAQP